MFACLCLLTSFYYRYALPLYKYKYFVPSKTWILYKSLFPSKNKINVDTTEEEYTRVERFQRRIKRFKGSKTGNKNYVHKPTP